MFYSLLNFFAHRALTLYKDTRFLLKNFQIPNSCLFFLQLSSCTEINMVFFKIINKFKKNTQNTARQESNDYIQAILDFFFFYNTISNELYYTRMANYLQALHTKEDEKKKYFNYLYGIELHIYVILIRLGLICCGE